MEPRELTPTGRDEVLAAVQTTFDRCYPGWGVCAIEPLAEGLDAFVFRADSDARGALAVRVPRAPVLDNPNDGATAGRALLEQERRCAAFARAGGLPAPAPLLLHQGDRGPDFLVLERVDHDGGACSPEALGELLARLHALAAPRDPLPIQGARTDLEIVCARTRARLVRVGDARPLPAAAPALARLAAAHAGVPRDARLLHLDPRSDNLLCRGGAIGGLVDWGNALVGDPALELARAGEYGADEAAVASGYRAIRPLPAAPPALEVLYRLDTAVMLAIVFLYEAPCPDRAASALDRVAELLGRLLDLALSPP